MDTANPVKNKGGRPTKCTDKLIADITALIRDGNYIEVSALAVGITERCYYKWVVKGTEREEQGINPEDDIYVRFVQACKKAHSEAETRLMSELNSPDTKNWQRLAWILERTRAKRYAQRQEIQVSSSKTGVLELPEGEDSYAEWQKALARG